MGRTIAGKGTDGGAGRPQPSAAAETGSAGPGAAQAMTAAPHPRPDDDLTDVKRRFWEKVRKLPDPFTPCDQLTDDERIALVLHVGEEVDITPGDDENHVRFETRYPVGFFNDTEGRVRVMRLSADLKRQIDEDRKNAPRIAL